MEKNTCDIERLSAEFELCKKIFTTLGDETRQYLLCIMLSSECNGWRVIDIAEKTNLSRPAVSHHMQIFKDAGIVKSRKEGTCVYYYLAPEENQIERMISLLIDIKNIMKNAPDRSGNDSR